MYNLMVRWSEQYLRNNPEMKIKETDGYRDWNTVSSSSDFEDFIKNKFIEDSDIIEKIYQRNESLIEVQKDKETIGGVHLEDNRTLNGLAIAPYARGDGTMFEAEFNLDQPIIAGKKTIRNVTDNQDVKIDADAFDDYVKNGEEYAYVFTLDHVWECYAIDRNYDDDYNVVGVNVKAETIPSEEAVA